MRPVSSAFVGPRDPQRWLPRTDHAEGEYAAGVETWIYARELVETAQQQSSAEEQRDREPYLDTYQYPLHGVARRHLRPCNACR
jgi:hypothetical protein